MRHISDDALRALAEGDLEKVGDIIGWQDVPAMDDADVVAQICQRDAIRQPGTIVHTKKGRYVLLGHASSMGGTCDCCSEFRIPEEVVQYCRPLELAE